MATPSEDQIKEVNHPGDDLWAFQVKDLILKNQLKKKIGIKSPSFPRQFWMTWFGLLPLHSLP